ncbi:MAG TPA: FecR family protein, partial [Burkholderiales bacterium]
MISLLPRKLAAAAFLALFAGELIAAVGTVQFSAGDVQLRGPDGRERRAEKGAVVNEGDTVVSRPGASAQLKMIDGGIIAVRPDTELKIDQYRYDGREDGSENAAMRLVRGGFRTITGLIGRTRKSNYKVYTPTATIGIRGTDHEPHFVPVPPAGQVVPAGATPPGTYDKVNVGVAYIQTPVGEVNIGRNQVGFAA